MTRANADCTPDRSSYGKKPVEVYKNNNVVIFNGRIGDDMGAEIYTIIYSTTIDYVIGTYNIVKYVKTFKVWDFEPVFSDVDCGLHTMLEFSCESRQSRGQSRNLVKTPSVRPGKWRNERKEEYVDHVDVSRVHELLSLVDDLPVEDITLQLKIVLIEPALKVFPQKSTRKYKARKRVS